VPSPNERAITIKHGFQSCFEPLVAGEPKAPHFRSEVLFAGIGCLIGGCLPAGGWKRWSAKLVNALEWRLNHLSNTDFATYHLETR
jgi:hypothetical protein